MDRLQLKNPPAPIGTINVIENYNNYEDRVNTVLNQNEQNVNQFK